MFPGYQSSSDGDTETTHHRTVAVVVAEVHEANKRGFAKRRPSGTWPYVSSVYLVYC